MGRKDSLAGKEGSERRVDATSWNPVICDLDGKILSQMVLTSIPRY